MRMRLIEKDKLKIPNDTKYKASVKRVVEQQPIAFNMEMVCNKLNCYGKYKGILYAENGRSENYIPVSMAKKIVRGCGLGDVLRYMDEDSQENSSEKLETTQETERDYYCRFSEKEDSENCRYYYLGLCNNEDDECPFEDCSTCKNNVEFPPPHTCDICTSLDQEEAYSMWEVK